MDNRIPEAYRSLWEPITTKVILYHMTTRENLPSILAHGLLPKDPSPKHWAGLKAVFLSLPNDPVFKTAHHDVQAHVAEKGEEVVRLHIKTKNQLYRSTDPKRTFQVISLDQISPDDITMVEDL